MRGGYEQRIWRNVDFVFTRRSLWLAVFFVVMDLFGIDLGGLIKQSKVPGVQAKEDDLILDLEQILPPPHIEGKVVAIRMDGEKIIQIFGSSDAKPVKNVHAGNYMAFKNNRIRLGKLLMNDTDLILMLSVK